MLTKLDAFTSPSGQTHQVDNITKPRGTLLQTIGAKSNSISNLREESRTDCFLTKGPPRLWGRTTLGDCGLWDGNVVVQIAHYLCEEDPIIVCPESLSL